MKHSLKLWCFFHKTAVATIAQNACEETKGIWSFYRIFSIPQLDSRPFLLVSTLSTETQRDSHPWTVCLQPMLLLFENVVPQISTWFHEILQFEQVSPAPGLLNKCCNFNMKWHKAVSPTLKHNVDLTYTNATKPWQNLPAPQSTSTRKDKNDLPRSLST